MNIKLRIGVTYFNNATLILIRLAHMFASNIASVHYILQSLKMNINVIIILILYLYKSMGVL